MTSQEPSDRKIRFDRLLDNYATALHISYQLLDSGILERKIKVGNNVDIDKLIRELTPAFAYDIRRAEKIKGMIKSTSNFGDYHGSALDIANAYFDELHIRGSEWEYADLADLFDAYKAEAEEELEEDKERY